MAKNKDGMKHLRFNVPEQDETTLKWLETQLNVSVSLRLLIKQDIVDNNGEISDVICRDETGVTLTRRKRPYTPRNTSNSSEAGVKYDNVQNNHDDAANFYHSTQNERTVYYDESVDESAVNNAAEMTQEISSQKQDAPLNAQKGANLSENSEQVLGEGLKHKPSKNRRSAADLGL